jgi:hypothetical protein
MLITCKCVMYNVQCISFSSFLQLLQSHFPDTNVAIIASAGEDTLAARKRTPCNSVQIMVAVCPLMPGDEHQLGRRRAILRLLRQTSVYIHISSGKGMLTETDHTLILPSAPALANSPRFLRPSTSDLSGPFAQATLYTVLSCTSSSSADGPHRSRLPFPPRFHIRRLRSSDTLARCSPYGEKDIDQTVEAWPFSTEVEAQSSAPPSSV